MAKDSRGLSLFWNFVLGIAGAFLATTFSMSTALASVAGRTNGSFSAGGGATSYNIPIFTPPGPRGMQPSVSLAYSSNGGVGYVGRGWSLTGFSSISFCQTTVAQDGEAGGTAYCIDGNRLKLMDGESGGDGSKWATEIADFSRVTMNAPGYPNPVSWVVERKDGTKWTYGSTSDSRTYLSWYVRQIEDRGGNKILFSYKPPGTDSHTTGTTHPVKIEWTQTSAGSGSYVYSMEFGYSSNGNTLQSSYLGFVGGSEVKDTDLLNRITVKVGTAVVRRYVLIHTASSTTGAMRLDSITECSDLAEADCSEPTVVTYQNGVAGVVSSPSSTTSISSSATDMNGDNDYNGDGINDITYRRDGAWYVRFGSTSGYGSEFATGNTDWILVAFDPFGTGRSVMLGMAGPYADFYTYQWNGSSFASSNTGITSAEAMNSWPTPRDVNGDGRDDLVYVNLTGYDTGLPGYPWGSFGQFIVRPSTSTGSTVSFDTPVTSTLLPTLVQNSGVGYIFDNALLSYPGRNRFDLNGDGRGDSLAFGLYYFANYDPWADDYYWDYMTFNTAFKAADYFQFEEFIADVPFDSTGAYANSDNCVDLYRATQLQISDCVGGGAITSAAGSVVGSMDWDADGRQDILVSISGATYVQLSTGQGMSSPVATGLPSCTGVFADADGDGLKDYVCRTGTTLATYLHNGATVIPDLAVTFTDGFGVNQSVTYALSTHEGYAQYTNATYPQVDVTAPQLLVRTVTATDGAGGNFTTTYSYFGATRDVERGVFQGFDKIEAVDSRNSTKRVQKFKREFPYSGTAYEVSYLQPGGAPIRTDTYIYAYDTLSSTPSRERYFRFPSGSVSDVYEVGGTKDGDWITHTVIDYTTYDGYGNLTASTRTVTDKDTSSPNSTKQWAQAITNTFATSTDRETYWCLGLPIASSVTHSTTTGETTVVQSQGFTPDYVQCRNNAVSIGSGDGQVDIRYEYDDFGNIDLMGVAGRKPDGGGSMTERVTEIGWGTTGQFPESETNALSRTTARSFDATFGALLTEYDPNGIRVAYNLYDSFGRISYAIRADGTYTYYRYYDCATYSWCQNGDPGSSAIGINKGAILVTERDSNDADIRTTLVLTDQFDRPIVQISQSIAGSWLRVGQQYDASGRVYRETAPCVDGSCAAYWTTNTYDLLGRLSTQSRPTSDSSSTPVTTTFAYAGRTQTVTDAKSNVTTKVLDVNGWMRESKDAANYVQTFGYDAAGNLKSVTDSMSNTLFTGTYIYGGARALKDTTTDMDLGTWISDYNSLGELVHWKDAKNQEFTQTYDALSRIATRNDDGVTTTWTWDANTDSGCGSYDVGKLFKVSMTGYEEKYCYDNKGRPIKQTITTDQSYDIEYGYSSLLGLLDTLTYPTSTPGDRVMAKYCYAYGILQSVTDATCDAGTIYWTANTQNPRGQTTGETLGNGVVTTRDFDAVTGALNSIYSVHGGDPPLQNHTYAYDAVGNVTQRQENSLSGGLTENFCYDNLYRLRYTELGSGPSSSCGSPATAIEYDDMGNITSKTGVGSYNYTSAQTGCDYYWNSQRHAVRNAGGVIYCYDANGNMTKRDGQSIFWTSYNYPTTINTATETTTFYYGPDRQYYRQEYSGPGGSETTHYIGGLLEKVIVGSTTDWRHYIKADGQVVAIVSRKAIAGTPVTYSDAVNYPLEDHLGSASTIANSSGAPVARESFDAFGRPRDGNDWDGAVPSGDVTAIEGVSRRGYTGHSMLGRMGLIHMNGRVQDSVTGRFLSADPTIPDPGFTQSYNRYAYVYNNPLSYIDPSGFDPDIFVPGEPCSLGFVDGEYGIRLADGECLDLRPEEVVDGYRCINPDFYMERSASGRALGCYPSVPPVVTPRGNDAGGALFGGASGTGSSPSAPATAAPSQPAPPQLPQSQCYAPFNGGSSFVGAYLARLGNLAAGLLDSVSGSVEFGLQIKGKLNVGPLLNATATFGAANASLGTSAAGNVDLNVRVPEPGSAIYGEASAGAGNLKFGAARDSVVDGISVRRGPYEDYQDGFFFKPTAKLAEPSWGKVGAHLQVGVGASLEVDFRKAGNAVSCAFQ